MSLQLHGAAKLLQRHSRKEIHPHLGHAGPSAHLGIPVAGCQPAPPLFFHPGCLPRFLVYSDAIFQFIPLPKHRSTVAEMQPWWYQCILCYFRFAQLGPTNKQTDKTITVGTVYIPPICSFPPSLSNQEWQGHSRRHTSRYISYSAPSGVTKHLMSLATEASPGFPTSPPFELLILSASWCKVLP